VPTKATKKFEGGVMSVNLPMLADDSGLAAYLTAIRRFPVLTAEQENAHAHQWHTHRTMHAAHALVTSHLRLVAKVAFGYRGYGLPMADIIAEGNIGLMQAVKKFDPTKGFRLATYAVWWIKAHIQEHILHSWSLVKIGTTAAQKKLFFNLRKLRARIGLEHQESFLTAAQTSSIAQQLNVSQMEVREMEGRLSGREHSLNTPLAGDTERTWQDTLADERPGLEETLAEHDETTKRKALLHNALATLPPRERSILTARHLAEPSQTLEELAQRYGISRERVRQLESKAMSTVQQKMQRAWAEAL
jgi:RNA polymerase sigma-32 factor